MPVGLPPRGGPLGRTRGRLSASALTTYLRCPRQWLLGYQVGLQGPTRPSQVLGIVLEEAFCDLLMMHPPAVASLDELLAWAHGQVSTVAIDALAKGEAAWDNVLWKSDPHAWEEVSIASIEHRLEGGLRLFMEEVEACFTAEGGPYLEAHRAGSVPFEVPAPTLGAAPVFPLPGKVRDVELRSWTPQAQLRGRKPERHHLARGMGVCTSWFKDPRVHQPQRLYHPDGWASGELDMVLRWDGHIRIVDIKLGTPHSAFSASLEHQLRFYAWLWHETHDGQTVHGMEGWYLEASERVAYTPPVVDEISELTNAYKEHYAAMQSHDAGVISFPAPPSVACKGDAAGCGWCAVARTQDGTWVLPERFEWVKALPEVRMKTPYAPLGDVQGRGRSPAASPACGVQCRTISQNMSSVRCWSWASNTSPLKRANPGLFLNFTITPSRTLCSSMHFRVFGETRLASMWTVTPSFATVPNSLMTTCQRSPGSVCFEREPTLRGTSSHTSTNRRPS